VLLNKFGNSEMLLSDMQFEAAYVENLEIPWVSQVSYNDKRPRREIAMMMNVMNSDNNNNNNNNNTSENTNNNNNTH
jgi:hypothetical protein